LDKIPENPGKTRENLGKIYENFRKIPEELGKLPENTSKNGDQRCLILKNPACAESQEGLFWRSSQKKVLMICVGGSVRTKCCSKTFRASVWGNSGKNISHPKQFASYTYGFYCMFCDAANDFIRKIQIKRAMFFVFVHLFSKLRLRISQSH